MLSKRASQSLERDRLLGIKSKLSHRLSNKSLERCQETLESCASTQASFRNIDSDLKKFCNKKLLNIDSNENLINVLNKVIKAGKSSTESIDKVKLVPSKIILPKIENRASK